MPSVSGSDFSSLTGTRVPLPLADSDMASSGKTGAGGP